MNVAIKRSEWARIGVDGKPINFESEQPRRDIQMMMGQGRSMCMCGFLAKHMFSSLGLGTSKLLTGKDYPSEAGLDMFRTIKVKSANGQVISVERELARINDRRISEYADISAEEQETLLTHLAQNSLGATLNFI